jgi:cell division transport system permease protein
MNRHGWREVTRQVRESGGAGGVAILLVAVATSWGGVLWNVRAWVDRELLSRRGATQVVAVLASPADSAALLKAFRERFTAMAPAVMSPKDLRNELAQWFPELATVLQTLDDGSFPPLLQAKVQPDQGEIVAAWLRGRPEVTVVESSQQWQARLQHTVERVTVAGMVLASALLIGCGVVVLLVVRLLVMEHSDEIAIMRLIGAHEREIRLPYLISGSVLGATGGVLGSAFLLALAQTVGGSMPAFTSSSTTLAALVVLGALAGALGAWLGLTSLRDEV